MDTKKAIRLSLILHLSPLLIFAHMPSCGSQFGPKSPPSEKGKNPPHEEKMPEILEIPKSINIEPVTEADINGYKQVIKKKFTDRKCPGQWYGGIGVQYNQGEKVVFNYVPSGYPAAKAGIEVGDLGLDDMTDYRGEVGKEVTVSVKKPDGRIKNYTMLREKICLKDANEK